MGVAVAAFNPSPYSEYIDLTDNTLTFADNYLDTLDLLIYQSLPSISHTLHCVNGVAVTVLNPSPYSEYIDQTDTTLTFADNYLDTYDLLI